MTTGNCILSGLLAWLAHINDGVQKGTNSVAVGHSRMSVYMGLIIPLKETILTDTVINKSVDPP